MKIKNVLSLFNGIDGARLAIDRAGIEYENFYISEIDKYANQISRYNYPDNIQLGDVTKWRDWDLKDVDLIIGGSPCQGFSFAGKQLNFKDPRSALFFEFVNILNHYKPKYFLLENVKMKKEYQDLISNLVGVEPVEINSALLSAQNRKRLYWCNWEVEQPDDKGILLKDIIEDVPAQFLREKSKTLRVGGFGSPPDSRQNWDSPIAAGRIVGRKINPDTGKRDDYNKNIETKQRIEINQNPQKTNALTTVQKDNVKVFVDRDKSHYLDANYYKGGNLKSYFEKNRRQLVFCIQTGEADIKGIDQIKRTYSVDGKAPTLSTSQGGHREPKITLPPDKWRKLTPIECERLQTMPDNWTAKGIDEKGKEVKISNTQRYKALGNGFTVDVIAHILRGIK